jgi:hypothetical protein
VPDARVPAPKLSDPAVVIDCAAGLIVPAKGELVVSVLTETFAVKVQGRLPALKTAVSFTAGGQAVLPPVPVRAQLPAVLNAPPVPPLLFQVHVMASEGRGHSQPISMVSRAMCRSVDTGRHLVM